jgi:hypothetical protein
MKFIRLSLLAIALGGFAGAAEAALPLTAEASFSDLYRLAIATGLPQPPAAAAQGLPVSFSVAPGRQAAQQTGFVVASGPAPEPGRWPLLFAGLAAAAWVARRRLNYSL